MGDLDGIHAGVVECLDDAAQGAGLHSVAEGMHPVAQRDVLQVDLRGHASTSVLVRSASFSAVRSAAEVMMSKFPA